MVLALLLLGAAPSDTSAEALMNRIEASVQLPEGAGQLNDYGRYYAFLKPSVVLAVYLVPTEMPDTSKSCAVSTTDGVRPCTADEIKEIQLRFARVLSGRLRAGQRRWVNSTDDIPRIADGGCNQITLVYDAAKKHVLSVGCNGRG